ncbi:MAG: hypothetical protein WCJ35_03385 [Planctomycetota bacterium]
MPDSSKSISLLDSLDGNWFKLPLAVMQDVGPAAQTLAGLMRITIKETFVTAEKIARTARLPIATARKHLVTLHDQGWINNKGRQKTRRNWNRRTATIGITQKTLDALGEYGFLPWWACGKRFPWSCKAVLSVVMARIAGMKRAVEDQNGEPISSDIESQVDWEIENGDGDADDPKHHAAVRRRITAEVKEETQAAFDNLGGNDRFKFSLKTLCKQTGLTRESVISAKRLLCHRFGIVRWTGVRVQPGVATETHFLIPNWNFRVIEKPAREGLVSLSFSGGSESGQ